MNFGERSSSYLRLNKRLNQKAAEEKKLKKTKQKFGKGKTEVIVTFYHMLN